MTPIESNFVLREQCEDCTDTENNHDCRRQDDECNAIICPVSCVGTLCQLWEKLEDEEQDIKEMDREAGSINLALKV